MKKLIAISALILMAAPVMAEDTKPVVLTPTALYDKIEKLEQKHSKVLKVLLNQNKRIKELERKMAGVQKRITILYSQQADK